MFPKSHLSVQEKEVVKEFASRNDLIITKADKGGATVIQDINSYIQEVTRQRGNSNFYRKSSMNLTLGHNTKISIVIGNFKKQNLMTEKTVTSLKIENQETPKFYTYPKIHKQENPGAPADDSISSHTSNLLKFVDHSLQPYVQKLSSYVTLQLKPQLKTLNYFFFFKNKQNLL